jgi:hypothetical protein
MATDRPSCRRQPSVAAEVVVNLTQHKNECTVFKKKASLRQTEITDRYLLSSCSESLGTGKNKYWLPEINFITQLLIYLLVTKLFTNVHADSLSDCLIWPSTPAFMHSRPLTDLPTYPHIDLYTHWPSVLCTRTCTDILSHTQAHTSSLTTTVTLPHRFLFIKLLSHSCMHSLSQIFFYLFTPFSLIRYLVLSFIHWSHPWLTTQQFTHTGVRKAECY